MPSSQTTRRTGRALVVLAAALLAVTGTRATPARAYTPVANLYDNLLTSGESLAPGERVYGSGYSINQQPDGNLVAYGYGAVLFATATFVPGSRTTMQADGNLVTYAPNGRAVFNTRTQGHPGAYLEVQEDGNLVVYSTDDDVLWSAYTAGESMRRYDTSYSQPTLHSTKSAAGAYLISRDYDQVAVLIGPRLYVGGTTTGATFATPPTSLAVDSSTLDLQSDGNLVLTVQQPSSQRYAKQVVWSTRTEGNPNAYVLLQTDGNLVVYSAVGRALWSSKFGRTY